MDKEDFWGTIELTHEIPNANEMEKINDKMKELNISLGDILDVIIREMSPAFSQGTKERIYKKFSNAIEILNETNNEKNTHKE